MPDLRDALQRTLGATYTIERELGGGAMSSVYLAEEVALGRRVVIKILPPELAHAMSDERFRQEIRLAARLSHPHIVPLLTAGESEGLPYYTMPYVEGETLRARLARGPLPVAEAVSLLRDVARALAYAHERGVVHRDIKPANVLVAGGSAMVTDFGIAKALSAATGGGPEGMTAVGVALGTPAYMAPEQAAGDPGIDHRADLYGLGCVAYEALTGTPPFAGRGVVGLLAAHALEAPEPPSARREGVPPALSELVMRCLAKEPASRPGSAADVLRALEQVPAHPGTPRPRLAALGAVVLVALAAATLLVRGAGTGTRAGEVRGDASPIHSVAVLPFVNTGGDPEDEYFSDGMTDELAHALAGLPDLRVAGRTSSYAYKGRAATVQEIGRALGVRGVVAGTVRRAGDRLRVTVQLSSTADGFQRWSHEYERRWSDVFALQDELTRAIVAELEPTLRGSATRVASERRGTGDPVAYEHYLRGRYFWQRRGATGLLRATDEFRSAIARDSGFARAWAGMALVYAVLPAYAPLHSDSVRRIGVLAARRALAVDSTVADGHLALASFLQTDGHLAEADAEFRRVQTMIPNEPTAYLWHGSVLQGLGRLDDALRASRRAWELDPLSAVVTTDQATVHLLNRRYPEAFVAARRALELDSTFTWAHGVLAQLHGLTGSPDSALAQLGLGPGADGGSGWRGPGWLGLSAWAYGLAGRRADVERVRNEIARQPRGGLGYDAALAAMALGDLEGAVEGIARGLERHDLLSIESSPGCTPVLEPLQEIASFRVLLNRYGMGMCGGATTPRPARAPA